MVATPSAQSLARQYAQLVARRDRQAGLGTAAGDERVAALQTRLDRTQGRSTSLGFGDLAAAQPAAQPAGAAGYAGPATDTSGWAPQGLIDPNSQLAASAARAYGWQMPTVYSDGSNSNTGNGLYQDALNAGWLTQQNMATLGMDQATLARYGMNQQQLNALQQLQSAQYMRAADVANAAVGGPPSTGAWGYLAEGQAPAGWTAEQGQGRSYQTVGQNFGRQYNPDRPGTGFALRQNLLVDAIEQANRDIAAAQTTGDAAALAAARTEYANLRAEAQANQAGRRELVGHPLNLNPAGFYQVEGEGGVLGPWQAEGRPNVTEQDILDWLARYRNRGQTGGV